MTPIACVVTAMARNTRASPTNVAVLAPSVAWSTIVPHDERPGEGQRRAGRQERAEDGPTTSVGPEQGEQGAPRDGEGTGHQDILSARSGRGLRGFMLSDPVTTVVTRRCRPWRCERMTSLAMEQDTATLEAPESTDELVEEELLVEEISIDGMCGVY